MKKVRMFVRLLAVLVVLPAGTWLSAEPTSAYAQWKNGPAVDPNYFPIGVWLQEPDSAPAYQSLGVNLYVGLWRGPTEEQLTTLRRAGMRTICEFNEVGYTHRDDSLIVGWMHGDEPDNAQSLIGRWGERDEPRKIEITVDGERYGEYGPPIHPRIIMDNYFKIRLIDPTRPVYLNLGTGVAKESEPGRGIRSAHPEDYAEYVKGADIVSFDIYPVNSRAPVKNQLWYVPQGVERLRAWTADKKPVWCWIECTDISSQGLKPTPAQVKSEVWMALIAGAQGFGYFCHEFDRKGVNSTDCAPLRDTVMKAAIRQINQHYPQSLAIYRQII
jgi:hypothetical protein